MRALVATRKGLFVFERGARWEARAAHHVGIPVSMALADRRDGAWYAALDHGHFGVKLHRSDDQGSNWDEIATPAYPEPPAEEGEGDAAKGWTTNLVWSLEAGLGDRLWCGTVPGGLFYSDDRGESWSLVRGLWDRAERTEWFGGGMDDAGVHSISRDPRDRARLAVGISCGGVWHTSDNGETWELSAKGMVAEYMPPDKRDYENNQDPHRMVRCPAAPDVLWVQHHNGIFRSGDGGRSWTQIESAGPSTFGFACAVHPEDPDTAWFVPGESDASRVPVGGAVVVTRTRDGGRTFDVLESGLPSQDAYDIVYRHALEVAADGQTLMMGSTTGNLWVSENQGDHWQCLSNHLPMVLCVRFA